MTALFSERGVTVDKDFARFGSKSYAIDKITSTDIKTVKPLAGVGIVILIIGLFFLFLSFGGFQAGAFIGIALLIGAFILISREAFALVIVSSAQEVRVLQDNDRAMIVRMKEAVETAMTTRNIDR